jgi:ACT domain-containing protein
MQSDDEARAVVRAVSRAVVGRLGDAGPQVIEAVVQEVLAALDGGAPAPKRASSPTVTTPRGAVMLPLANGKPTVDYCAACVEQEKARGRQRAVMTTTGRNSKGIVARVTARIAELGGDILDISQTLVGDYFTMIIVIDVGSLSVPFERFQEDLQATVRELGCQAMLMHEDVMASLHRV